MDHNKKEVSELINVACKMGQIILENGGETYRVEQTINIVCKTYNYENTESFVTPTGIMISITDENDETTSLIKRINSRTVNLNKVSIINDLSRRVGNEKIPISKLKIMLKEIDNAPNYTRHTAAFFTALASGAFCVLFGGGLRDFFVSFVVGFFLNYLGIYLTKIEVNTFFINAFSGFLASIFAILAVKIGLGANEDKIIIGSIMLLLPGISITNAVRDIIAGDLVSGISRTIEAFLNAIAIALGTGVGFNFWMSLFGGF
ncbi:threonine/serine exporter family protein [Hathewaya histolytica]|uniref:Membrane spanning protein n=1 Tax=Hathewaya histolytica TaxID=1498 RepID=A0A4U9RJY0_HATHI|nr:threonine/serine exporter family protein [Hathewaya histolytica]VTQ92354.1 membrane spanning protein [Hathewaya histolytica]